MATPSVFEFESLESFLREVLNERKLRRPNDSLRAWAKQLGYRNPSTLSDVMRGRRKLGESLRERLSKNLGLSEGEATFLKALGETTRLGAKARDKQLREIRATIKVPVARDTYADIASWYVSAILELFHTKDFQATPKAIARRLGGRVTVASVEHALESLVTLGSLKRQGEGYQSLGHDFILADGKSCEAVRSHHREMLTLATQALDGQPIDQRHFSGCSLAIRREDYGDFLKAIETFYQTCERLARHGDGEEVYRINTQFFSLTEPDQAH